MQSQFPFQPRAANQNPPITQVALVGNGAVQQVAVPVSETETTIRIMIDGPGSTAWCYGSQAALTLANGVAMLGNSVETFNLPAGISQLSFIGPATMTFRVHFGDGT